MGVITKYAVGLEALGLSVSNDLFNDLLKGQFVIDAEVTAEMIHGWPGSAFEVSLLDLPEKTAKAVKDAVRGRTTPVKIDLGYFDGPFGPVMEGLVDEVIVKVRDNKLVTTLKGLETATAALHTETEGVTLDGGADVAAALRKLLEGRQFERGRVALPAELPQDVSTTPVPNRVPRGRLLTVLDELARLVDAELLVMDGKVWMGRPVRRDDYLLTLVPDENLAVFEPFERSLPAETPPYALEPLRAETVQGFRFVATGDPKLRPGHKVDPRVQEYEGLAGAEFRVASLVHRFTLSGGYTCEGVALKPCPDARCRVERARLNRFTPEDIARRLTGRVDEAQRRRPFVEVGKVKQYRAGSGSGGPGHRATMFFGQRAPATEAQPSVNRPVNENPDQVFADKPLASSFAWNRCGLVVPVYPGMKALLHHNQGLADDPVVGGFLWSQDPLFEPPQNREGDYWLCLPIDFDSSRPPTDSTKAANDLTANNGKRVIEAKGLRLTIGASKLRGVGTRPEEGGDDELLIEHASGTEIKVASDGTLSFKASKVEIEGDLSINGNVEIK